MALVKGTNCGFVATAPTANPTGTANGQDSFSSALKDVAPVGATTVTEIGMWIDNATQAANMQAGIYDHDSGGNVPVNLLGNSGDFAKGTSGGVWVKATGLSISITAGTTYWIAIQMDDTLTVTNTDITSTPGVKNWSADFGGSTALPDPWGEDSAPAYLIAIYAVYTTAGGTNMEVNIGDVWKDVTTVQINIGDTWKTVTAAQVNIGDTWKTIF